MDRYSVFVLKTVIRRSHCHSQRDKRATNFYKLKFNVISTPHCALFKSGSHAQYLRPQIRNNDPRYYCDITAELSVNATRHHQRMWSPAPDIEIPINLFGFLEPTQRQKHIPSASHYFELLGTFL